VIITEVDPTKALEAVMDGFRVMSMKRSSQDWRCLLTVTGNKSVLTKEHYDVMKNGAIIANSGHFNVEIDIPALEKMSSSKRTTPQLRRRVSLKDVTAKSTCWAKAASSTWRRRRTSAVSDGHELRRPGALGRIHGKNHKTLGEESLSSA